MERKKVVIMGAAGMDFHIFNTVFRGDKNYEVVAFTMASEQNLGTVEGEERKYPPGLAGGLYPNGIPIRPESELEEIIEKEGIDQVVLAYSDISHNYVMHSASRALAAGADFRLVGVKNAMLKSKKPVVSVCAVRTGCGKSQVSRKICRILKEMGKKVVAVREPMPYGNLVEQAWMRFEKYEDLEKHDCTIEEREEYEPYIEQGLVVYSGVDYQKILEEAEKEADVIVWDGGNNEISFYKPDLQIVLVDPHRPGHELRYHPGEVNFRLADVIFINKVNTAEKEGIREVEENIKKVNPEAEVIRSDSGITVDKPEEVKGKKVLVVEDGPTLTHGDMPYGAGTLAAEKLDCQIVDPRPNAVGSIKDTYREFSHLGKILPAMGYSREQIEELEETINNTECDAVLVGTPIDLARLLRINKPAYRVKYDVEERGKPNLKTVLERFK